MKSVGGGFEKRVEPGRQEQGYQVELGQKCSVEEEEQRYTVEEYGW